MGVTTKLKGLHGCHKGVSGVLEGSFQGFYIGVTWLLHEGIAMVLQACYRGSTKYKRRNGIEVFRCIMAEALMTA